MESSFCRTAEASGLIKAGVKILVCSATTLRITRPALIFPFEILLSARTSILAKS